jgi:alkyl hydroperoxide reductase subunit AhpC
MPAAFTFNCPTEIEDAAEHYAEFQKAGAEVYIVTTDTHFSHKVWHETSPAVGKAKFPLVGDPTHALTNALWCAHRLKKAWHCAAPSSSTPMA